MTDRLIALMLLVASCGGPAVGVDASAQDGNVSSDGSVASDGSALACSARSDCPSPDVCCASQLATGCTASCAPYLLACRADDDCPVGYSCGDNPNFPTRVCQFTGARVPPGEVVCLAGATSGNMNMVCGGADPVCCELGGQGTVGPSCTASAATCYGPTTDYVRAAVFRCDGPEDCQTGVCCALASDHVEASCAATCSSYVVCHQDSDCTNGATCELHTQLSAGATIQYRYCSH